AGHVALPQAHAQVPYVDTNDIADVVVAALLDDRHNGKVYQLTGPETWTFEAVVAQVAKATNREIGFTAIPMEAYMRELKAAGLPEDYVWLINYLFTEVLVAEGNNAVTDDIQRVLGRPPRTMQDYIQETAASGVWDPARLPVGA
ncbi:MAG: NmrA family transcriptional regulator, partial [Bacteroidota bacterium]